MDYAINYAVSILSGVAGGTVTHNNGMQWWQVLLVTITPTLITALIQTITRLVSYIMQNKGLLNKEQAKDIIDNVDKKTEEVNDNDKSKGIKG